MDRPAPQSQGRKSYARKARLLIVRASIGLVLGAIVIVGGDFRARAQTNRFVSTTGDDQGFGNDCSNSGQPCKTIQNAINHSDGGDEIDLGPGTYIENVRVRQSVTIRGDAVTGSTVDGNAASSVFVVDNGVSATLDTLTITNGRALVPSGGLGGGILNKGTLAVTRCAITSNHAPQTIVVSGPTTTTYFGLGGGIYNLGNLTLINSTVNKNSADDVGGGIDNHGTANVVNCTIADNVLSLTGGGGGGIFNDGILAVLSLTNNIIARNDRSDCDAQTQLVLATNDRNFVGDGRVSGALSGDPMLGPFQNNGGPTFTYALQPGSSAIDAGDDAVLSDPLNLTADQRGPGFPRKACAHVDIGAYEAGAGAPPTITCPANITATAGTGQNATVSFGATASDPCNSSLMPIYKIGNTVITSPHVFGVGVTTVTVSATDSAGLTASCGFTVTVLCPAPTIACPANIAVYSDPGSTTAKVSFAATASDPCDGAIAPVYTIGNTVITSPYAFPPGVTTVTATATGSNGLTGSCTFTVTVTLLNDCIQDDHTGDTFRFNSTTGQYVYTRCADKLTLTGTGAVRNVNGLNTLTDNLADRRISAMFNPGSLTGRATVVLVLAPGVYQTIIVSQTNPSATCACP
jgi:hypothetical protein